jgi:HTH-type transcriptional regulator, competence development regulator
MTSKLSKQLYAARQRLGYTLRDIERLSHRQITNAYISMVEHGIGENISPKKLRVLCKILKLDYMSMMMAAGHITKKEMHDRACQRCGYWT